MLRGDQTDAPPPIRTNPFGNITHPGHARWEEENPYADRVAESERIYAERLSRKLPPPTYDPNDWAG